MSLHRCLLLLFISSLIGGSVALGLGLSYRDRLASHQGRYHVLVSDAIPAVVQAPKRPRRAVVVVLDGLGYKEALIMRAVGRLRELGQCRKTHVGPLPLSRPVYAVLSTGMEADRTGVGGNNDPTPLAAESIWEVARQAGLSVVAVSELPWWGQLFPAGFSAYRTPPPEENYLRLVPPADLALVHPVYIDEIGHQRGAGSAGYRAAVARADGELSGLIATLDPRRDLVVLTADHGHSLRGGHGGQQDRVAHVLTCYAGPGVLHRADLPAMSATSVAPSLALLLGLRFPVHMRAGEDDLDVLFQIADPAVFPPGYLDDRRQAVEHFRAQNRAQLLRWLPESGASWAALYAWHRQRQVLAALPLLLLALGVLALHRAAHRRLGGAADGRRGAWIGRAWMAVTCLGAYALQVWPRGSFDMTSIEGRPGFIRFTLAMGILWGSAAGLVHLLARRRPRVLFLDLSAFLLLSAVAGVMHPVAFGFTLGFPLPPPPLYFFPYFAALFIPALCGVGLSLCLAGLVLLLRPTPGRAALPGPPGSSSCRPSGSDRCA